MAALPLRHDVSPSRPLVITRRMPRADGRGARRLTRSAARSAPLARAARSTTSDRTKRAASPLPTLTIVPRRRRAARALAVLLTTIAALMLAAVILHTRLAERQFEIDRLDSAVVDARDRFDLLRRQRAELRSPARLSIEATRLGMVPAKKNVFAPVSARAMAEAIAAAGAVRDAERVVDGDDPLDQFRQVKAVSGDGP